MKQILAIIFLAIIAFGQPQSSNSPSQSVPIDQVNAQKAKAVIDRMIAALGGQAYLSIQDVSQEGRTYSFYHGRAEGAGTEFWRFYKFPDKDRFELTKQRDVVEIFNGNKGYEITYKGKHDQPAKDVTDYIRRRQYSLDQVLRNWIKQPGIALFYEGQTVAAGKPAEQVTIMNADNDAVTLFADMDTHLPVKKSYSWRDPTDKERNTEEEIYDNYRLVQGIMTPHTLTRYYNGDMSNQRFMSLVKYNQDLSDTLFDPSQPLKPVKK